MILYSKGDLERIYNELKEISFIDTPIKSKLIFKDMKVFGIASPFSLNLFININKINKYQWPKKAVIGLFAHELSHMVSYKRRSFLGRVVFIWNYPFSAANKQKVEHEADRIAIERGYGRELVQQRIHQFRDNDKKHVERQKKVYYRPETLEKMVLKLFR